MRVVDLIDFTPYHYLSTYTKVSTRKNFQNENIWRRSVQKFCQLFANENCGVTPTLWSDQKGTSHNGQLYVLKWIQSEAIWSFYCVSYIIVFVRIAPFGYNRNGSNGTYIVPFSLYSDSSDFKSREFLYRLFACDCQGRYSFRPSIVMCPG